MDVFLSDVPSCIRTSLIQVCHTSSNIKHSNSKNIMENGFKAIRDRFWIKPGYSLIILNFPFSRVFDNMLATHEPKGILTKTILHYWFQICSSSLCNPMVVSLFHLCFQMDDRARSIAFSRQWMSSELRELIKRLSNWTWMIHPT